MAARYPTSCTAATPTIIAWPCVLCIELHVICTLIAAGGIARVWTAATHEGRPPSVSRAAPELVCAMILHGAYNATVMSLKWPGLMFLISENQPQRSLSSQSPMLMQERYCPLGFF